MQGNEKTKVSIYGDSILKGVIFDEQQERYVVAEGNGIAALADMYGLSIKNNSKFGYTINDGMKFFDRDMKKGIDSEFVLVEYGGNDCNFKWNEISENPEKSHIPNTRLAEFEEKLKEIIAKIRELGKTPIMMTLPPIDSEKYLKFLTKKDLSEQKILKWLGDVNRIYRHQELYSCAVASVAKQTQTSLCDVRSTFLKNKNYKSLICNDGIHPTVKGQMLIVDSFYRFIGSLKKAAGTV